jgi:5-methylcytosine-specific restriction enzyme A
MAWRVCSTPGCPTVHDRTGKCIDCRRKTDRQRGSRQARGYDAQYERARATALDGATRCMTCRGPFTEDNPATGGHVRAISQGGTAADGIGAECQRCNYGKRRLRGSG